MNKFTPRQINAYFISGLTLALSLIGAITAFVTRPGFYGEGIWNYRWWFVGMVGYSLFMLLMVWYVVQLKRTTRNGQASGDR